MPGATNLGNEEARRRRRRRRRRRMAKYRAAVIGLGWMGLLYDLAKRVSDRFEIGDVDRPTPSLDIHRRFHHHDHPGEEGNPTSYSEALWARPETELVAAADRDGKRLKAFSERYGIQQVYTSAEEMLRAERPEVVAVCTNTATRADLTCLAVECGARAIFTEKPMAHTLAEADRMVETCRSAGVPLSCGCITTTHPSFARAREIVDGAESVRFSPSSLRGPARSTKIGPTSSITCPPGSWVQVTSPAATPDPTNSPARVWRGGRKRETARSSIFAKVRRGCG